MWTWSLNWGDITPQIVIGTCPMTPDDLETIRTEARGILKGDIFQQAVLRHPFVNQRNAVGRCCGAAVDQGDFGHTIAIRHLIHHTSGLRGSFPELLALAEWRDTDATTTDDVYWLLKAQRELNLQPGAEFLYVNSNYILLALICERVSGQSFATFCQERFFDPLSSS